MIRRRSALHPTLALVGLLVVASAVTLEREPTHLLPIASFMTVAVSLMSGRPLEVMGWAIRLLPMGIGLGVFSYLASPDRDPDLLALLPLRVWTMTASALLLAYGTDPWELAWSLTLHFRFPRWISAAVAIAHSVVLKTLESFDELRLALSSKGILTNPLDYFTRSGHLMRVVVHGLAERADRLSTALEARGFDPNRWSHLTPLDLRFIDLLFLLISITLSLIPLIL